MKIAYIIHDSKYGEPERKFLHYIVDSARFAQPTVLLLQPNKITEDLDKMKIPYKLVKGLNGASTYLRFNPVSIVNVLGSSKIANNIANFVKKIKIIETHFEASKDLLDSDRTVILEKPYMAHRNAIIAGTRLSPLLLTSQAHSNKIVFATRDLDQFNLLVPARLAECLHTHKDDLEVVVYSPNPAMVTSKIKALAGNAAILSLPIETFAGSYVFVDAQRNSDVTIAAWESLMSSKVIVPNNEESSAIRASSKDVQLYEVAGSIELLRFYCLSKKEGATPIPEENKFGKFLEETYALLLKGKKPTPTEIAPIVQVSAPPPTITELSPLLSDKEKTYIIIPYSIYGGAEVYLSNYLEGQDPSKVALVFLANNIPMQRKWQATYECIGADLARLASILIKKEARRVLFYNSRVVYQTLAKIKQSHKFEFVEIVHSYLHWQDSMHGVLRSAVDKTFCVAHAVAKQWGLANYEVLPPKIDAKRFKLPKRTRPNKITIGTVARLSPEKNLFKIFEIAALLDDRFDFVIVGADGGSKKDLQKQARAKGLVDRVHFRDYTAEVEKEYATFDLFLLTSNVEGTPLTILEAMAAELPIVASNVGAIKEMLEGYKQSFVFDLKNTPNIEIANQIKGLLQSRQVPPPTITDDPIVEVEASIGGPRILLLSSTPWEKWLNYSPAYWIYLAFEADPDCDISTLDQISKIDLSKYSTIVFNGKLDFWDKDPFKYDEMFKNHVKWHIQNDLHCHSLEIQKTKARHASYVDWITSAYPLSIEETDLHNRKKGKLIPIQANCPYRHKIIRLPHALLDSFKPVTRLLKDRKDVILTGHRDKNVYPWRVTVQKMYNLPTLEHPGYDINKMKHNTTHQKYIEVLGQHKVSFADGGVVNYAVNKYMEVPFAGCVLICKDIPEISLLGFKHGKNCFIVESPLEVGPILNDVIKNPDKYQAIANAGQKVVLQNHMAKQRWAYLKGLIRSAENNDRPASQKHIWYDNDPFAGQ